MLKALTFIVICIMALVLLVFTASRTLDLLQTMLPAGQQSAFAYLGLVAFDGGLLGWSFWFAYGARGMYQRAIALLMVIASLLAVGISTIADLYIGASSKGLLTNLSEGQRLAILLAVGGVIFLNVAAFFLTHITDPERLRAMAVESAKDKIHARTLELIAQRADVIAPDIADQLAEQFVHQSYAQLGLSRRTQQPAIAAPVVNAAPMPVQQPQAKRGLWGWLAKEKPVQVQPAQPQPAAPIQQQAIEVPDKLAMAIEALTDNPNITDDELAEILDLRKPASARYWRLKAMEFLTNQSGKILDAKYLPIAPSIPEDEKATLHLPVVPPVQQKGGSQNGALPFPHS